MPEPKFEQGPAPIPEKEVDFTSPEQLEPLKEAYGKIESEKIARLEFADYHRTLFQLGELKRVLLHAISGYLGDNSYKERYKNTADKMVTIKQKIVGLLVGRDSYTQRTYPDVKSTLKGKDNFNPALRRAQIEEIIKDTEELIETIGEDKNMPVIESSLKKLKEKFVESS